MKEEIRNSEGKTEKEFLEEYSPGDYPRPSVTADILVFSKSENNLEILLIKRGNHPFIGKWALPGGFANPGERLSQTAQRELLEETGIKDIYLEPLGLYSEPNRDPRDWTITHAYIALADKKSLNVSAGDDAAEAKWFNIKLKILEEEMFLEGQSEDIYLTATMGFKTISTPFGERFKINLRYPSEFAFDHAKIIAHGILRLKAAKLI